MADYGRITEAELYVPALRLMAQNPDGSILTTKLIEGLRTHFRPTGDDALILANRQDDRFSQKVRNIKSHSATPGNIIYEGYAEKCYRGLKITDKGRAYLKRRDAN